MSSHFQPGATCAGTGACRDHVSEAILNPGRRCSDVEKRVNSPEPFCPSPNRFPDRSPLESHREAVLIASGLALLLEPLGFTDR